MFGDTNTIFDITIHTHNNVIDSIVNYIIGNNSNKYITTSTNPIIDSIVIHSINNISIYSINGNTYNNGNVIIDVSLSMVVVLLMII